MTSRVLLSMVVLGLVAFGFAFLLARTRLTHTPWAEPPFGEALLGLGGLAFIVIGLAGAALIRIWS